MSLPKVSIVVTTYAYETKPYLDLCIESIENLDYPKECLEVIVVCNQFHQSIYQYGDRVKVVAPIEKQFYNPRGLNFGISSASPDSDYYLILNDDVILTRTCLLPLIRMANSMDIIVQPISPCDNYRAYSLQMGYIHNQEYKPMLKQFHRMDEFKPEEFKSMMNSESMYPAGAVHTPSLCMFATLIPKIVWEKVGKFDENFKTGQDDIDYSIRASQKGVAMVYCLNSLVWHFGGVTADTSISLAKRKENIVYFKEKWGFLPPGMPENILETIDESYKYANR